MMNEVDISRVSKAERSSDILSTSCPFEGAHKRNEHGQYFLESAVKESIWIS